MFKKEAHEFQKQIQQEYLDLGKNGAYPPLWERIGELWGKGAEFGYNKAKVEVEDSYRESLCNSELNLASVTEQLEELEKANKWHYVKDGDLPTKELEGKQLLVRIRNYTENFIFAYYMLDLYYSKNGKRFYSDTDCNYPIDIGDVIAWKEIVLPKEIEK